MFIRGLRELAVVVVLVSMILVFESSAHSGLADPFTCHRSISP